VDHVKKNPPCGGFLVVRGGAMFFEYKKQASQGRENF